jgi:hypothetical protein
LDRQICVDGGRSRVAARSQARDPPKLVNDYFWRGNSLDSATKKARRVEIKITIYILIYIGYCDFWPRGGLRLDQVTPELVGAPLATRKIA